MLASKHECSSVQQAAALCNMSRALLRYAIPSLACRRFTRFGVPRLARSCANSSSASVDDSLKAALAKAAAAIQERDPQARQLDGGALTGATLTGGPKMVIRFTCTYAGKEAPKSEDVSRVTTCAIHSPINLCKYAHTRNPH